VLLYCIVLYCTALYCPVLHFSTLPPGMNSYAVNNINNNNNSDNNKFAVICFIINEFLPSQLGNIHLSWNIIISRIRLDGLIYSLKSSLQLNMCQELEIFAFVYMYLDAN
jgi:hypothetical protein